MSWGRPFKLLYRKNSSVAGDFEHIGRRLSKSPTLSVSTRKKYQQMAKSFPQRWTAPVLEENLHGPLPYEMEGMERVNEKSYDANVVIEIRDVRLPATSHHPSFFRLAKHRRHLICYTHADLVDQQTVEKVEWWTQVNFPDAECRFVDANANAPNRAEAFQETYEWITSVVDEEGGNNCALTLGVPNTGKSSVLQALLRTAKHYKHIQKQNKIRYVATKKGKKRVKKAKGAPAVEDTPGKTRELTEYLIRESPRQFFLDVPGTTPPSFFFRERPECFYAMGATNLLFLNRKLVKDARLFRSFAKIVLHAANRDHVFDYVGKIGLENPSDDIDEVLSRLSQKYADKMTSEALLLKRSQTFLKLFNTGNLGPIIIDDLKQPFEKFVFKDEHFRASRDKPGARGPREDSYFRGFDERDDTSEEKPDDDKNAWYDDYDSWVSNEKKRRAR